MLKMNCEKKLSKKEIESIISNNNISKSEKMKELFINGIDVKSISIMLNVRYNFVYNVVSNFIRINDIENNIIKEKKENKKDDIIKLIKEGKSNIEISKELKCNYNYVWKIVNEYLKNSK